jgi:hypothetical protein
MADKAYERVYVFNGPPVGKPSNPASMGIDRQTGALYIPSDDGMSWVNVATLGGSGGGDALLLDE